MEAMWHRWSGRSSVLAAVAALAIASACATAGDTPPGEPDASPRDDYDAAGPAPDAPPQGPVQITISHSATQDIVQANSVSCNGGDPDFFHAENSYYRTFLLSNFGITSAFDITRVEIGIEQATGFGGSQPASVNLYTVSGAFQLANLTQIGSANITVVDQNQTVLAVPITATAPAGSTLAVEFLTPDGQAAQHALFIGSNTDAETAPSYLRAPTCDINEPTATANIGFPDMHIVMNVTGTHMP